ncbi:hypothetical protein RJ639_034347 [Escallonia herrerae]|uniref:Uncharacterized protein n=1 Tax=Escallonia herrerae TaxID=1293975 RepID=A0AA88WSG3_9ASTE|nr:hypothetical protein RJ639_034347 [Escallonia herrerae]
MEETRDEGGAQKEMPSNTTWWPSDFIGKMGSVSLDSNEETLSHKKSNSYNACDMFSSQNASQILWSTGMLSEPIPNGFYSVIPDTYSIHDQEKRLKDLFHDIPTLDDLYEMELEGLRADIILVDVTKDKKLSMLKQLILALVKGLNSNPAAVIKKIAGLIKGKRMGRSMLPRVKDSVRSGSFLKAGSSEFGQEDLRRGTKKFLGSCKSKIACAMEAIKDLDSKKSVGLVSAEEKIAKEAKKLHLGLLLLDEKIWWRIKPGVLWLREGDAIQISFIRWQMLIGGAIILVSDVYKRPNLELSPSKAALEETYHASENRGVQMLGQIKNGSRRPRAILFKVLADAVGLESRLMVGLPSEGASECIDSYKHMSVIVVLNSTELLVDLMRFPGQLLPRSTKAIFMTHISAAGESDSAENDSCDSPLEPNSPLYGFSDRVDPESTEKDDSLQYQRRLEASLNVPGPSLRNMMMRSSSSIDRKMSLSHSEPNIATSFWRRSRRKAIAEQRTASSSPEHPSFRARGRSMLSGDRKSFREYTDVISTSRSEGASTSEPRRLRRRSISMTPEIGDDIVRAVRAMNETLKQNRLVRDQGDSMPYAYSSDDRNTVPDIQKSSFIVDTMTDLQAVGGMKKLNNSNYNAWLTCMMSYMQGQDLWEVVNRSEVTQLEAEDANGTLRKWKIKAGKAMFALKTTVEEDVLEHIRDATTLK